MHSESYGEHLLYYPQKIGADYLPSGVPAGSAFNGFQFSIFEVLLPS